MTKKILVRFGDMMLKGKNIGFFIKKVRHHLSSVLDGYVLSIECTHDRALIEFDETFEFKIPELLNRIPGIYDYAWVDQVAPNLEEIIDGAVKLLDRELLQHGTRLKIETRRTDKDYPLTSLEITQKIASSIISGSQWNIFVDVNHPEEVLRVDLRKDRAYLYLKSHKGMGGYPFGVAGKALMMLSGGLDSPVAAYLSIKQGMDLDLIHFESTPLTSLESVQKVIDTAKVLASYAPTQSIKLYLVPMRDLHEHILKHVFDPYIITVLRRMMYRIADQVARSKKLLAIVNGESVGQVASQTLQSMQVIENVVKHPILRPLLTYDKLEIVRLAKSIGTYEISTRPFEDCCTVYLPKSPVTKPMEVYASKYEETIDYRPMMEMAIKSMVTMDISVQSGILLTEHGWALEEAIDHYLKSEGEKP